MSRKEVKGQAGHHIHDSPPSAADQSGTAKTRMTGPARMTKEVQIELSNDYEVDYDRLRRLGSIEERSQDYRIRSERYSS